MTEKGSEIEIGCSVTHNQVIDAIGLDHALDLLRMACLEIGSAQLRNRATVVGNVVTASPANDTVSALVALDSRVVIESSQGSREVPIRDFFTGFRKTNLERTELVRSIKVPRWSLEDWVRPLRFDRLISSALLARLQASLGDKRTLTNAHQLAFVKRLGATPGLELGLCRKAACDALSDDAVPLGLDLALLGAHERIPHRWGVCVASAVAVVVGQ